MAVNKVFPRSLSKSKDTRFRKKTEMSDALNLRATESVDAFVNGFVTGEDSGGNPGDAGAELSPTGNMGVLKPVAGNIEASMESAINSDGDALLNHSIIGSVSDESRGHVYFFVWHSDESKYSVLRYIDDNQDVELIYMTKWFNFSYNSLVQGAVTHVSSSEFGQGTGEKTFLYFTDNYNEPRCLDVNACLSDQSVGYSDNEVVQFISLCPIAPSVPVVPVFAYDPLRNSSNFRNSRGIQFAYQNVHTNGTVSAFSIYSKLAINPSYLFQGADPTPDVEAYNYISLRVPVQNNNVESIRLYGREGNDGAWFFIDDVRQSDAANGTQWNGPFDGSLTIDDDGNEAVSYQYYAFSFYGDGAVSYIAEDLTFKQFDSVPKLAEAISISNDRLFLGNYVEGFDKPEINADITYEPLPRPDDFQSFDINLIPEVRVFDNQTGGVKNRTAGYRLDMSSITSSFDAGSTVNINITLNPDKNLHLYNSKSSFHSSSFFTHNDQDNPSLLRDRFNDFDDEDLKAEYMVDPDYNPTRGYFNKTGLDIKSFVGGVFTDYHDLGWDPMAGYPGATRNKNSATWVHEQVSTGEEISNDVIYGSSAANPLILSTSPITFYARIFCETTVSKQDMAEILGHVLSGKTQVDTNLPFVEPGPAQFYSNKVTVIDSQVFPTDQINLNLNSYDYISSGSAHFDKVCALGTRNVLTQVSGHGIPPCGYFIVNKADVTYGLVKIDDPSIIDLSRKYAEGTYEDLLFSNSPSPQTDDVFFALDIADIRNEETLTCIPDIPGGYMPTHNVLVDAVVRTAAGFTFVEVNPVFAETVGGIPLQTEFSDFYLQNPYCEKATNKISGWVVLRKNAVVQLQNGGDIVPLLNSLTSVATKDDLSRIARELPAMATIDGMDMPVIPTVTGPGTSGAASGSYQWNVYNGGQIQHAADPTIVTYTYIIDFPSEVAIDESYLNSTTNGFSRITVMNPPNQDGFYDNQHPLKDVTFRPVVPFFVINEIKKFLGYLELPGRSTGGLGGPIGPDLDGPRPFNSGVADGSLLCTRTRVASALNQDLGSGLNFIADGQRILKEMLGHTLVDGEAGPGSVGNVGSINSTTVRDGVLYYYISSGMTGGAISPTAVQYGLANLGGSNPTSIAAFQDLAIQNFIEECTDVLAFYGGTTPFMNQGAELLPFIDSTNLVVSLGIEEGLGENVVTEEVEKFLPPTVGYWTNPFEYYFAYRTNATIQPVLLNDENIAQTGKVYDGRLGNTADVRNFGSANINLQPFFEADQVQISVYQEDYPTYYFTDALAWYTQLLPHVEITLQQNFVQVGGEAADRKSFKSNANHNFGVVYSDFYGRQSTVYPLGSAFVPPYDLQPGGDGGAVNMKISINNDPPEWAYSYQIVYGGNTSYNDFIQYTAGGAFVVDTQAAVNDDLGFVSTGNIYVSLNYLQGNSDVSYIDSFGARPADGSDRFYEYRPGDKLRVVSYYDGGTRTFANGIEFDVSGLATLGDNDENPLFDTSSGQPVPKYLQGNFVILKNNPSAVGFNVNSINQGGNVLPNPFSRWNNRCVFELYSPASIRDQDEIPYHEVGESYRVVRVLSPDPNSGNEAYQLYHEYNPMTIREGDVYFRRHALNFPLNSGGSYQSIINAEGSSVPLFSNYYLESRTFNDNIVGANSTDRGRTKVVDPGASEIRRYASVIFSDQDNYTDTQLRLNSFDATKAPFKDLPNSYGSLPFLVDYNDSLFALQQTKASLIPVNRTLLSDASGSEALIATSKVLGTQKYYAGENGCDTNPESVAIFGNTVFWANKQKGEVYKFSPSSGIKNISDIGMRSYFRNMFSDLASLPGKTRVVGGYDINHDEYIVSAYNQNIVDFTADVLPNQDIVELDALEGDGFVDLNEGGLGDLNLNEAVDLFESIGASVIATATLNSLQDQIDTQASEIQTLLAELSAIQATISPDDLIENPDFEDVISSYSGSIEVIQALRQEVLALTENQVDYHGSIRDAAQSTYDLAIAQLAALGYIYTPQVAADPFQLLVDQQQEIGASANSSLSHYAYVFDTTTITATGIPGQGFSAVDQINYPGYNAALGLSGLQPVEDVANYLAFQAQRLFNIVSGYSTAPTSFTITIPSVYGHEEQVVAFETGYGIGPEPIAESFIGAFVLDYTQLFAGSEGAAGAPPEIIAQAIEDANLGFLGRPEINEIRSEIFSFSLSTQQTLADIAAESNDRLEGLASQIYQISLAIKNYQMPDLTSDDPNNIPDSISDYTVDAQLEPADAVFIDETGFPSPNEIAQGFAFIRDITETMGNPQSIIAFLEGEATQVSEQAFRNYIKGKIKKGVTTPTKQKRIEVSQQLQQVEETRNALAYMLSYTLTNISSQSEDFTQALIDAGVDPTLADVLTNQGSSLSNEATYEAIIAAIDTDDDGSISSAEIIAALPGEALVAAAGTGGPSTWEAARSSVEGLIADVVELSQAAGIIDAVEDNEIQQGFSVSDIGLIEDITNSLVDSRWADGDVEFISESIDNVRRRISAGDNEKADLIKIYQELQDRLVQMSVIASQAGYSSFDADTNLTEELQSEVFRGTWHMAVDQVKGDVQEVVTMLTDFQNLFSAVTPDDLNVTTAYGDDVAVGAVAGPPANAISYGAASLDGVKAGQLLSGTNVQYRNESGDLVDLQSAFFGLASVISKVNQNIRTLAESTPSGIEPLFLNPDGESLLQGGVTGSFADLLANQRNISAILPGDVTDDLIAQYEQFTTADVSALLAGALDTSSDLYNPSFADQLASSLLTPAYSYGFDNNTSGNQGDINSDGFISFGDITTFTSLIGNAFPAAGQVTIGGDDPVALINGVPVPIIPPQPFPSNGTAALNFLSSVSGGGNPFAPTIDEEDLIDPTTFTT